MAVGRPTKLNKALIEAAKEYKEDTGSFVPNALLPTIEGLALRLGISRECVYEWCRGDDALQKQFSDIVDDIKALQAEKLIQKSLAGHYNPTIAKLILSGKHGYVEKSEIDQNLKGDVTFINDVPRPKGGDA